MYVSSLTTLKHSQRRVSEATVLCWMVVCGDWVAEH